MKGPGTGRGPVYDALSHDPGGLGARPKGAWQDAWPTLVECARHEGRCAYRQGDPNRCDWCHATWQTAARWPDWTGVADHLADHQRADLNRTKANAARQAKREEPTPPNPTPPSSGVGG